MCLYCQYDHGFWDDIVRGAQRIRILTSAEVTEVEAQLAATGKVSYPLPSTPPEDRP